MNPRHCDNWSTWWGLIYIWHDLCILYAIYLYHIVIYTFFNRNYTRFYTGSLISILYLVLGQFGSNLFANHLTFPLGNVVILGPISAEGKHFKYGESYFPDWSRSGGCRGQSSRLVHDVWSGKKKSIQAPKLGLQLTNAREDYEKGGTHMGSSIWYL